MKILLDTNFFLDVIKFRIELDEISDILTEPYQLVTLNSVVKELEKISKSKSTAGLHAKTALRLIETKNIAILTSREKNTDKAILQIANKDIIVATNDSKLRKELKRRKSKTIYLRARKYVAIG
ncbi:MAG: PIN domain-containing protein [Candidatus Aenigmatarchaeota archaeon]